LSRPKGGEAYGGPGGVYAKKGAGIGRYAKYNPKIFCKIMPIGYIANLEKNHGNILTK
jgi:hypothetical protein